MKDEALQMRWRSGTIRNIKKAANFLKVEQPFCKLQMKYNKLMSCYFTTGSISLLAAASVW